MTSIAQNQYIDWIYYTYYPGYGSGVFSFPANYTFTVLPGFGSVQISMSDFGINPSYNPDFEVSKNGTVLKNTNFVFGKQQPLYFDYLEPGQYTITVYLQSYTAPTQRQ